MQWWQRGVAIYDWISRIHFALFTLGGFGLLVAAITWAGGMLEGAPIGPLTVGGIGVGFLVLGVIGWHRSRGRHPLRHAATEPAPTFDPTDYTMTYDGKLVPRTERLRPPTPAADPDADVIDVTAEALVALFEGKTELQGQAAAKRYVGERIRVSGRLAEVHTNDRLTVTLHPSRAVDFLYFGPEWTDQLAKLSTGDPIQVVGTIQRVLRQGVSLDHCQLAQSSRAAIS